MLVLGSVAGLRWSLGGKTKGTTELITQWQRFGILFNPDPTNLFRRTTTHIKHSKDVSKPYSRCWTTQCTSRNYRPTWSTSTQAPRSFQRKVCCFSIEILRDDRRGVCRAQRTLLLLLESWRLILCVIYSMHKYYRCPNICIIKASFTFTPIGATQGPVPDNSHLWFLNGGTGCLKRYIWCSREDSYTRSINACRPIPEWKGNSVRCRLL